MTLIRKSVLDFNNVQHYNGIDIEELSFIPKINLRGESSNKDFMGDVSDILNTQLPEEANICIYKENLKIIWLSPNEWLIQINNEDEYKNIYSKLHVKLNPYDTAITDVSENRTIMNVRGKDLYKLLAKFMVIDFDNVLKKESSVAQTIFNKVPVLIVRNHVDKDQPNVDIHSNRSHSNYIYNLLVDGCSNFNF